LRTIAVLRNDLALETERKDENEHGTMPPVGVIMLSELDVGVKEVRSKNPDQVATWSGNGTDVLEQELQTELNETRVTQSARDHAKVGVVARATDAIGIAKLGMVKQVEKLGPELQAEPAIGSESGLLKYGNVKIVDALQSKAGIHSCLIAEPPIWRRCKARSVEPTV
jgi:hypothetical protein